MIACFTVNYTEVARKKRLFGKIILSVFIIGVIIAAISGYKVYKMIYGNNVALQGHEIDFLYIPTGSEIDDVTKILYKKGCIINKGDFEWVAEQKNYQNHVHPGKYEIKNGMSNNELVDLLRSGNQTPVHITFNNIRTIDQLAGAVAKVIEADSASISDMLHDKTVLKENGFNENTVLGMFIPNTYEFFWNTTAKGFVNRMKKEYDKFWNKTRLNKAKQIKLTQNEVVSLASIIEMETKKDDEKPRVAGVYMNRINKGMKLQADPTVIYAIGDFSIRRVLKTHLDFDSPYNTYKYSGLPPGPISMPSIASIDAVLNYEKHKYLFFCAKEDFSGYHNFAVTLREHNLNAKRYQKQLNKRKILN